jgi:hypothetical protein
MEAGKEKLVACLEALQRSGTTLATGQAATTQPVEK